MRAAVLFEENKPLEVVEVDLKHKLGKSNEKKKRKNRREKKIVGARTK